jgi:hypothetical protein
MFRKHRESQPFRHGNFRIGENDIEITAQHGQHGFDFDPRQTTSRTEPWTRTKGQEDAWIVRHEAVWSGVQPALRVKRCRRGKMLGRDGVHTRRCEDAGTSRNAVAEQVDVLLRFNAE